MVKSAEMMQSSNSQVCPFDSKISECPLQIVDNIWMKYHPYSEETIQSSISKFDHDLLNPYSIPDQHTPPPPHPHNFFGMM